MKGKRHTTEQKIRILRRADEVRKHRRNLKSKKLFSGTFLMSFTNDLRSTSQKKRTGFNTRFRGFD